MNWTWLAHMAVPQALILPQTLTSFSLPPSEFDLVPIALKKWPVWTKQKPGLVGECELAFVFFFFFLQSMTVRCEQAAPT